MNVRVDTPNMEAEMDLDRMSTLNLPDEDTAAVAAQKAPIGNRFMQSLWQKDRSLYEKLTELVHYFQQLNIDLRDLAQLKSCFGHHTSQVPIATFKECVKNVFAHFR